MKTQKAKGILRGLPNICSRVPGLGASHHTLISDATQIHPYYIYEKKYFARPCPTQPRHGFVESRYVESLDDIRKLFEEVKKADSEGELLLGQAFNKVAYNVIYTENGTLSVGTGNAGATGGKKSISLPVAPTKFNLATKRDSGLSKDQMVFIEAILANANAYNSYYAWYLTQLRGGPKVNATLVDFIPEDTKVVKVVKPHNNLLRWEEDVKKFAKGTVVWGSGHTLTSHAAIHCVLNNIPFITSFEPKKNDTIRKTSIAKYDVKLKDFKKGVMAVKRVLNNKQIDIYDRLSSLFKFCLSTLHNWAYIRNSEHNGWMLGATSYAFSVICASMVFGEARHARDYIDSFDKHNISCLKDRCNYDRESIYKKVFTNDNNMSDLSRACRLFYNNQWREGYGGIPWALCAWYANTLWVKFTKVFNTKNTIISDEQISLLLNEINLMTTLEHNNGWWFTKISSEDTLNSAANHSGLFSIDSAEVFHRLYFIVKEVKEISPIRKAQTTPCPFILSKNNKALWAFIKRDKNNDAVLKLTTTKGKSVATKKLGAKLLTLKGSPIKRGIYVKPNSKYIILPNGKKIKIAKALKELKVS